MNLINLNSLEVTYLKEQLSRVSDGQIYNKAPKSIVVRSVMCTTSRNHKGLSSTLILNHLSENISSVLNNAETLYFKKLSHLNEIHKDSKGD